MLFADSLLMAAVHFGFSRIFLFLSLLSPYLTFSLLYADHCSRLNHDADTERPLPTGHNQLYSTAHKEQEEQSFMDLS